MNLSSIFRVLTVLSMASMGRTKAAPAEDVSPPLSRKEVAVWAAKLSPEQLSQPSLVAPNVRESVVYRCDAWPIGGYDNYYWIAYDLYTARYQAMAACTAYYPYCQYRCQSGWIYP